MKKYKFTGEKKVLNGVTLRRIVAVMDFYAQKPYNPDAFDEFEYRFINKGTLGGWLESEENLSHEGFAWVADEACVYGKAKVIEGGLVYGEAQIFDEALIENYARVFGRANVYRNAVVTRRAAVWGNADLSCGYVTDDARIYGNAKLFGDSCGITVDDKAEIFEDAVIDSRNGDGISIGGEAKISGHARVIAKGDYEVSISDYARIEGHAEIHSGSSIRGEAHICESARVFGAIIGGCAIVQGKTRVLEDTRIDGCAKVCLNDNDDLEAYLRSGAYLDEDAEIETRSDYFIVDPIILEDEAFSMTFFRDSRKKMRVALCRMMTGIPYRIGSESYPVSNNIILEYLLHDDFDDNDNVPPELIETVLAFAKIARDRFAQQKTEEQA